MPDLDIGACAGQRRPSIAHYLDHGVSILRALDLPRVPMKHSVSLLVRTSLGRFLVLQRSKDCDSLPVRLEFRGGSTNPEEFINGWVSEFPLKESTSTTGGRLFNDGGAFESSRGR